MAEILVDSVKIPAGVQVELSGSEVRVSGSGKSGSRHFRSTDVHLKRDGSNLEVWAASGRRNIRAEAKSIATHIHNMLNGLGKPYEYRLEIVYSHFPINASVKQGYVEISNVGGAKHPKKARILGETKVEIKGKDIIVKGHDKEAAGQSAANMEQRTRIKGKDMRVFQDGIYITQKPKRN